jgi:hypothetical protein
MDPEMVLNELSLQNPANDYYEARRWMDELVGAMSAATGAGVARVLRTKSDVRYAELAPGYPVVKWLNDQEVDREARRYFLTLVTKAPLLQDVIDEGVRDKTLIFDFFQREDRADGFGVAFLLEALPLSLRSDQRWDADHVELKVRYLDDSGELMEDTIEVVHVSRREHVRQHDDWIAQPSRTQCPAPCLSAQPPSPPQSHPSNDRQGSIIRDASKSRKMRAAQKVKTVFRA